MRASWIAAAPYAATVMAAAFLEFRSGSQGYRLQREWHRLPSPYSAHVIGEAERASFRVPRSSPLVEVNFPDGRSLRFTSKFSDAFSYFSNGSSVKVLTMSVNGPGGRHDLYEVDDDFHLWLGAILGGSAVLVMGLGLPASIAFSVFPRLRRMINGQKERP